VCVLYIVEGHCVYNAQCRRALWLQHRIERHCVCVLHSVERHCMCTAQCREVLYVYSRV